MVTLLYKPWPTTKLDFSAAQSQIDKSISNLQSDSKEMTNIISKLKTANHRIDNLIVATKNKESIENIEEVGNKINEAAEKQRPDSQALIKTNSNVSMNVIKPMPPRVEPLEKAKVTEPKSKAQILDEPSIVSQKSAPIKREEIAGGHKEPGNMGKIIDWSESR